MAAMTGAEKYFAQLKESPAYKTAYDEAKAEIVGENGVWVSYLLGHYPQSFVVHQSELDALRRALLIGGTADFRAWGKEEDA